MKFAYTIIYVTDVIKTAKFYTKAFGLELEFIPESKQYAQMKTGQTALAFVSEAHISQSGLTFTPNRTDQKCAGFVICLETNDVDSAFNHAVASGAKAIVEPCQKPWGQRVASVSDINGVLVELCSPLTN